jgi:hypothetical protein
MAGKLPLCPLYALVKRSEAAGFQSALTPSVAPVWKLVSVSLTYRLGVASAGR